MSKRPDKGGDATLPENILSRRIMLARIPAVALAATAIVPLTAVADRLDPVFAKIKLAEQVDIELGKVCHLTDEALAKREGRIVTEADEAIVEAAYAASRKAEDDLIATIPLTLAGVHAMLSVTNDLIDWDRYEEIIETILQSPVFNEVTHG
jgi:hypothetical protein